MPPAPEKPLKLAELFEIVLFAILRGPPLPLVKAPATPPLLPVAVAELPEIMLFVTVTAPSPPPLPALAPQKPAPDALPVPLSLAVLPETTLLVTFNETPTDV